MDINDKTKYGIPYMGSKRKLAKKIVDYIIEQNPNMKYFYDLFGGGGAISFEMLKRPNIKVIYNEFDPAIVNLIKKIRDDGVTEEFYQWIDRDTFFKYRDGVDWFSGMIKTCWSFGNCWRTYLYGKKIEHYKNLIHNVVVNKCQKSADEFNEKFGTSINAEDIVGDTINERRLFLQKFLTKNIENKEVFKGFCGVDRTGYVGNISEHLERLQHLEGLEHLERLEHLVLLNKSYDKVIIETPIDETVIYCDPPYKNTEKYQNNIDHNKFDEWVENNQYKVYLSEYSSKFNEVMSWETRSTMSATNNNTKATEKLYCNREENKIRKTMELF